MADPGQPIASAGTTPTGAPQLARAAAVEQNLYELLEVDVTYDGWEHETGEEKAFYVRGFTWFRDKVIHNKMKVTKAGDFIPAMKTLIQARPNWLATPFAWQDPFGARQFIDVASPHTALTPKFQKAVEVIALCEAIAADLHGTDSTRPPPVEVYDHMRIEAAVSYIHGFDATLLAKLESEQPGFMNTLRLWTGQGSNDVFNDMAAGKTVTHKLAKRTRHFLSKHFPTCSAGDVDFHFSRLRTYEPSPHEYVDVKERTLPLEARA